MPEPKETINKLHQLYPKLEILWFEPTDGQRHWDVPDEVWAKTTILVTLAALPQPSQAPNLKLIHFFSAGINRIGNHPIYTDTKIPLTTSSGVHGPQIAEHVYMTLLSITHHLPILLEWQKKHQWNHSNHDRFSTVHDLAGQRLGVLGYGSIGRQVARVARGFGMDVIAYTATPKDTDEKKKDQGYIVPGTGDPDGSLPSAWYSGLDTTSRHEFLSQGLDVLLVAVPLTKDTRHFLSTEEFKILSKPRQNKKKGAFVVNIARGPIVDTDALVEALKAGLDKDREDGLWGASLDVTDPEPLPEDHVLWDLENCVVTPHVSSTGSKYNERAMEIFLLNLGRLASGGRLINEVNRKSGY